MNFLWSDKRFFAIFLYFSFANNDLLTFGHVLEKPFITIIISIINYVVGHKTFILLELLGAQSLGSLVQIEENNTMIAFTLMPALLYNDTMLESFINTFITCSSFAINTDL